MGSVGNEQLARAYEAGCDGFVDKQQMGVLDHIVRAALRNKSAQEDLADHEPIVVHVDQDNRQINDIVSTPEAVPASWQEG